MFPLFITHDEYFVQCSGSGGGYYNVFDMSSYELLSGWRQCGGSASAAARRRRVVWRQCWQLGSGGSRAVAARQRQRGNGSVAVVATRLQHGRGQPGGGVGQCGGSVAAGSMAAVLTARRRPCWQHPSGSRLGGCGKSFAALQRQQRQQSGRSCAAAACRHGGNEDTGGNSNGGGTTKNQQSTKSSCGNGDGNDDNNDK
jgi:hypothetical protein